MDTTNSPDFSIYQCRQQSKHGSLSTHEQLLTTPTHSLALAISDKQLQLKNPLCAGIRNDNYYECLTDYDINVEDEDYDNDNTITASYNGHIKNKGNLHYIQNDHNLTLPPRINQICTFKDFLPSPIPINSTMTKQYTNGNLTHQKKTESNKYNNDTNGKMELITKVATTLNYALNEHQRHATTIHYCLPVAPMKSQHITYNLSYDGPDNT